MNHKRGKRSVEKDLEELETGKRRGSNSLSDIRQRLRAGAEDPDARSELDQRDLESAKPRR